MEKTRLTQFSKGSGCGCKIAPADLQDILAKVGSSDMEFPGLIVGNGAMDDAAVMKFSEDQYVVSTTDFFTPIVDDASDFGQIAAANAISDVYAMGGKPIMAVGILGWPIEQLGPDLAAEVIKGSREICNKAGIPLAGGHSIDSKEPFFGLAVTGIVSKDNLKRNNGAKAGDTLFLTKPLGSGILSTAMKRGIAKDEDTKLLLSELKKLNTVGFELGKLPAVNAMTDVTGFGLLGHLIELCEASGLRGDVQFDDVPKYPETVLKPYLDQFVMPDNTMRNFKAYGSKATKLSALQLQILCDPQTNGGLLLSVSTGSENEVIETCAANGIAIQKIGSLRALIDGPVVTVS
ncbi:selenide, water dikinase SelD [Salibacteraceae bacterium]|jgi:selenide, water dikinase|nr:selenide, water dikinase SelD [Salibacteraceae bacterium]